MKNRKYTQLNIGNNTSSFSVIPAPDNNEEKAAQDDAKTGFVTHWCRWGQRALFIE